jgi:hypothetical protein
MLTSRDRVLCALNHEEPDRVPIFFGASGATTMLAPAYDRLKAYLGFNRETKVFWQALQYALLDEEMMARFGADGRPLIAGLAPSTVARELSADALIDSWALPGSVHQATPTMKSSSSRCRRPMWMTSPATPGPTWRIPAALRA